MVTRFFQEEWKQKFDIEKDLTTLPVVNPLVSTVYAEMLI